MVRRGSIAMIAAIVLALATFAAAQRKDGKTVHITLKSATQVGSFTLPSGEYEVTHRTSPTGHYMEFARATWTTLGYEGSPTYYERRVVANVDCTMQSLTGKVNKTVLEKEGSRMAAIEIKGESVSHNF
jgi:hypothetical protein